MSNRQFKSVGQQYYLKLTLADLKNVVIWEEKDIFVVNEFSVKKVVTEKINFFPRIIILCTLHLALCHNAINNFFFSRDLWHMFQTKAHVLFQILRKIMLFVNILCDVI